MWHTVEGFLVQTSCMCCWMSKQLLPASQHLCKAVHNRCCCTQHQPSIESMSQFDLRSRFPAAPRQEHCWTTAAASVDGAHQVAGLTRADVLHLVAPALPCLTCHEDSSLAVVGDGRGGSVVGIHKTLKLSSDAAPLLFDCRD